MLRHSTRHEPPHCWSSRRRCGQRFPALRLAHLTVVVNDSGDGWRAGTQRHGARRSRVGLQLRSVAAGGHRRGNQCRGRGRRRGAWSVAASGSDWSGHPRRRARPPGAATLGSWYFPMSVTAMPLDAIGAAMGRGVSTHHQCRPGRDGCDVGQPQRCAGRRRGRPASLRTVRSCSSSSDGLLPTTRSAAPRS